MRAQRVSKCFMSKLHHQNRTQTKFLGWYKREKKKGEVGDLKKMLIFRWTLSVQFGAI